MPHPHALSHVLVFADTLEAMRTDSSFLDTFLARPQSSAHETPPSAPINHSKCQSCSHSFCLCCLQGPASFTVLTEKLEKKNSRERERGKKRKMDQYWLDCIKGPTQSRLSYRGVQVCGCGVPAFKTIPFISLCSTPSLFLHNAAITHILWVGGGGEGQPNFLMIMLLPSNSQSGALLFVCSISCK